ncbi:MAG TPA: hypothetical protein PLP33_30350 [Leptospiraceae bacterium]|nr:hypothetical protein [Leptospiraceae bacterium]
MNANIEKHYSYPKPLCDKEAFLEAVKKHKLNVIKDENLYRHLIFYNPECSWNQWFEIVTYPKTLVYSGDMGTYVFSRVEDMFKFFRRDDLKISPSYWAQKCTSYDRDGIEEFSSEYFTARIEEWMDECEVSKETREEVKIEVLWKADEGDQIAMRAAMDFKAEDGFYFADFWEQDCNVYTYRFLWCLYAIVWGIQQYDNSKNLEWCNPKRLPNLAKK